MLITYLGAESLRVKSNKPPMGKIQSDKSLKHWLMLTVRIYMHYIRHDDDSIKASLLSHRMTSIAEIRIAFTSSL